MHAVARVEDDGRQQHVEEDLRVEGGGLLNVDVVVPGPAMVLAKTIKDVL